MKGTSNPLADQLEKQRGKKNKVRGPEDCFWGGLGGWYTSQVKER